MLAIINVPCAHAYADHGAAQCAVVVLPLLFVLFVLLVLPLLPL